MDEVGEFGKLVIPDIQSGGARAPLPPLLLLLLLAAALLCAVLPPVRIIFVLLPPKTGRMSIQITVCLIGVNNSSTSGISVWHRCINLKCVYVANTNERPIFESKFSCKNIGTNDMQLTYML